MMHWMRALFDAVFIDTGERAGRAAALTVAEQRPYMEALIADRRTPLASGAPVSDDLVTRLVAMGEHEPWLDDDAVRRNVNGVIVGAVDTTSKAVAHAVDELLRRPAALDSAQRAAAADDIDKVRAHAAADRDLASAAQADHRRAGRTAPPPRRFVRPQPRAPRRPRCGRRRRAPLRSPSQALVAFLAPSPTTSSMPSSGSRTGPG